jgi:hypothetical protein
MNAAPAKTLGYHDEAAGAPGFTGETLVERCAAVGARCTGEDMYITSGDTNPVRWWVASLYHRPLIMEPAMTLLGGGQAPGGPQVMDGAHGATLLTGAIGLPAGDYDGQLWFSHEAPDPGTPCAEAGMPISEPYGTAITVAYPIGEGSDVHLRTSDGAAVPGCSHSDWFIPDDPLRPRTTYVASAVWTPDYSPEKMRPLTWTFTTGDGEVPGDSTGETPPAGPKTTAKKCATKLTAAGHVKRRHALKLGYRACGRGTLTANVLRVHPRTAKQRRPLLTRTLKLKKARSGSLKLATGRLSRGHFRLRVKLTGTGKRQLVRQLSVR